MKRIYGLIDTRTSQVRYVGCTGHTLNARLFEHIEETLTIAGIYSAERARANYDLKKRNYTFDTYMAKLDNHCFKNLSKLSPKQRWILILIMADYRPSIKLIEMVEDDDASERELYWIKEYLLSGHHLTNNCSNTKTIRESLPDWAREYLSLAE